MTREEAIDLLSEITMYCDFTDQYGDYINDEPYLTALDMAIECLQSSEMWNGTTTDKRIFAPKGTFQKVFEDGKAEPCEDCISKTELLARIDAERKHLLDIKMDGAEHIVVHHARRIIEDMPSVYPTRPKGKWIDIDWDDYEESGWGYIKCSNCGIDQYDVTDFCPKCGADMRGDVE